MKTRLREILMLSGVEIPSDEQYMKDMKKVQQEVSEWHEDAKGDDKYFGWKCRWAVKQHGADAMIMAVEHLYNQSHGNLMYPMEDIIKELKNEKIWL